MDRFRRPKELPFILNMLPRTGGRGEPYAVVITWLRTRLLFEILRSVHLRVRGSRTPFRTANEVVDDFRLNVNAEEVFLNEFRVFSLFRVIFLFCKKMIMLMMSQSFAVSSETGIRKHSYGGKCYLDRNLIQIVKDLKNQEPERT